MLKHTKLNTFMYLSSTLFIHIQNSVQFEWLLKLYKQTSYNINYSYYYHSVILIQHAFSDKHLSVNIKTWPIKSIYAGWTAIYLTFPLFEFSIFCPRCCSFLFLFTCKFFHVYTVSGRNVVSSYTIIGWCIAMMDTFILDLREERGNEWSILSRRKKCKAMTKKNEWKIWGNRYC